MSRDHILASRMEMSDSDADDDDQVHTFDHMRHDHLFDRVMMTEIVDRRMRKIIRAHMAITRVTVMRIMTIYLLRRR